MYFKSVMVADVIITSLYLIIKFKETNNKTLVSKNNTQNNKFLKNKKQKDMSTVINPRINQNLIYFYDLPTGEFTSVSLAKIIKEKTGHDIERQPQVRRDVNKPFYTAVVKITDNVKFSEVCK